LWEELKTKDRIRASLFNLVIYGHHQTHIEQLQLIVNETVARFPCRIIFIKGNLDPDENYIKVNVSIEIPNKSTDNIACDKIELEVSANHLNRVPYIVLPHLLPDLPIYLLWGEDPTEEKIVLPSLRRYASRLLYNASCTDNLQLFAQRMLAMIKSENPLELMDISWLMLRGWRQVIAQIFDSDDKRENLRLCTQVTLLYSSSQANCSDTEKIQATYLAAWLADRMSWQFLRHVATPYETVFVFFNGKNECQVIVKGITNTEYDSGRVYQVDIQRENLFAVSISPCETLLKVCVHLTLQDTCELPYTLPLTSLKVGPVYIREMFYSAISKHYPSMLEQLTKLSV